MVCSAWRWTHGLLVRVFRGHEAVGVVAGGGMLTFLVLLPLHVATLPEKQKYCMSGLLTTAVSLKKQSAVEWRKSVATLEQSMPHGVLSQTSSPTHCVQRAKIFSSMWSAGCGDMWICTPISSKKQFQRGSACSENKERKSLSTCSNEMSPKPARNAKFAKFSRENLAQIGLQKYLFRYGKNPFFWKRCFYEHGSRSAGMFTIRIVYIQSCIHAYINIILYIDMHI